MRFFFHLPKFLFGVALLLSGCASTSGNILSGYESRMGRSAAHAGIDFGASYGTPIIAAADGVVSNITVSPVGCGKGVTISHYLNTGFKSAIYCHMSEILVPPGKAVKRGEVIGRIGTSGNASGVPHVHFEISIDGRSHIDGDTKNTEDPSSYIIGCYDPSRALTYDKFVLTNPIPCSPVK